MSRTLQETYGAIGAIFAAGLFLYPFGAQAATTVYFDVTAPTVYVGDTFLIDLKVSSLERSVNAVEGTILYDPNLLEIQEVSTGNSLSALWPKPPVFSNDTGTLSFAGGAPDGFQGEKEGVLKIIFLAKNEGEAKLDFLDGFSIFLHDGQGTQINPWLRPLSLNILKRPAEIPARDEWRDLLEKDKTPPEFIETIINRDPHIFDNQYFVSFFAVDKDSGIAYYEIKEGDRDFVRAESPHILQDQSLKSIVQIKAVDTAGNESVVTPKSALVPRIPYKTYVLSFLSALVIPALIFWLWRLRKVALFLGFFVFLIFPARAVNAATLYFSPSSSNFSVGDTLTSSVLVNTQGKSINSANVVVRFPTDLLEVVSVDGSGSIFSLWVEGPSFSNSAGTISFDGGLPTPGFNGAAGKLLNVVFRAKSTGTASLIFSSGAVRANDGSGTNILQTKVPAQYSLIPKKEPVAPSPTASGTPPVAPSPTASGTPPAPIISPSTHPDSTTTDGAVGYLSVAVLLIALVLLLGYFSWYWWRKFMALQRNIKKEIGEVESALHKAFDLLKEAMHEQIKMLEKTKTKRRLTEEEDKIIKQLKKDLDDAEKFVRREIEDIKKEVK